MGTVYVFFADGFEEIEAFTSVDVSWYYLHLFP